jgi:hypothetical protein
MRIQQIRLLGPRPPLLAPHDKRARIYESLSRLETFLDMYGAAHGTGSALSATAEAALLREVDALRTIITADEAAPPVRRPAAAPPAAANGAAGNGRATPPGSTAEAGAPPANGAAKKP